MSFRLGERVTEGFVGRNAIPTWPRSWRKRVAGLPGRTEVLPKAFRLRRGNNFRLRSRSELRRTGRRTGSCGVGKLKKHQRNRFNGLFTEFNEAILFCLLPLLTVHCWRMHEKDAGRVRCCGTCSIPRLPGPVALASVL